MISSTTSAFIMMVTAIAVIAIISSSSILVNADLASLRTELDNREAALGRIVGKVETAEQSRCSKLAGWSSSSTCLYAGTGSSFPASAGFQCTASYGQTNDICTSTCSMVRSETRGTVLFAPSTDFNDNRVKSFLSIAGDIEAAQKAELSTVAAWMGVGYESGGTSAWFPGNPVERGTRGTFEPRTRPWYIAGSSSPKQVVLVVDTSGSMSLNDGSGKTRLQLLKDAANVVINSLTENDYFGIVEFSSSSSKITGNTLLKATQSNINFGVSKINGLSAGGGTRFSGAVDDAFELLRGATNVGTTYSGCANSDIIILLSDGEAADKSAVPTRVTTGQSLMPNNRRAQVMTIAQSCSAETALLKELACAWNGIFFSVADNEDPTEKLSAFYKLMAYGLNSADAKYTNRYDDAFGLGGKIASGGGMVSAARPIYDKSTANVPIFAGVASVDIQWSTLKSHSVTDDQIREELQSRSRKNCANNNEISQCFLQYIRSLDGGYVCPNKIALNTCRQQAGYAEIQSCKNGPASVTNMMCESLSGTRYVATANPKNSAEAMCCAGCATAVPKATSLAEVAVPSPGRCSAGVVSSSGVVSSLTVVLVVALSALLF